MQYHGRGEFGNKKGDTEFKRELGQFEWFTEGDYYVWREVDCKIKRAEVVKEWFAILQKLVDQAPDRKIQGTDEYGQAVFYIQTR